MALTAAVVLDGIRCKIVDVTESAVNGAAASLALTFLGPGPGGLAMTADLPAAPLEIHTVPVASATDEDCEGAVIAAAATGFTFRRLETGAGATSKTWRVTLRVPRGIAR